MSHERKKEITVTRYEEDLNANDWSSVFKEFRSQIEDNLTEEGKAIISKTRYSTTSEVIDDVSCIALMEAMSKYFAYRSRLLVEFLVLLYLGRENIGLN